MHRVATFIGFWSAALATIWAWAYIDSRLEQWEMGWASLPLAVTGITLTILLWFTPVAVIGAGMIASEEEE